MRIEWLVLIWGLKAIQLGVHFNRKRVMHHHWSIKWDRGSWSASTDLRKGLPDDRELERDRLCNVAMVTKAANHAESSSQMHNFCGPSRIRSGSKSGNCIAAWGSAWTRSWSRSRFRFRTRSGDCKCELLKFTLGFRIPVRPTVHFVYFHFPFRGGVTGQRLRNRIRFHN